MKMLGKLLDFISEVIVLFVFLMFGSLAISIGIASPKLGLTILILAILIAGCEKVYDKYIKEE